jgi:hypothetical protein
MDSYEGTTDPSTLHKYLYTRDNPVNGVDPTGYDDLEEYEFNLGRAEARYPSKVARCEAHHIFPKYLGGDPNGETALIPAAYHQLITNAFRDLWSYGIGPPDAAAAQGSVDAVYKLLPLTFAELDCNF